MSKQIVDNREFVKAWVKCESVGEVAKALRITKSQASAKANVLRAKGVKLPAMSRTSSIDVDSLNALIRTHNIKEALDQKPKKQVKQSRRWSY